MPDGRRPQRFSDVGLLLLAVEVLSPATLRRDRHDQRKLSQDERVADYWIVDPSSRVFEQRTPEATEPHVRTITLVWQPVLSTNRS